MSNQELENITNSKIIFKVYKLIRKLTKLYRIFLQNIQFNLILEN